MGWKAAILLSVDWALVLFEVIWSSCPYSSGW